MALVLLSKRVKWDFPDILETNCKRRFVLKCSWQVYRWFVGFCCVVGDSVNPWASPLLALNCDRSLPRAAWAYREQEGEEREKIFLCFLFFWEREKYTWVHLEQRAEEQMHVCDSLRKCSYVLCLPDKVVSHSLNTNSHTNAPTQACVYTHTHTHIHLLPRLHGGRSLGLLIISPAERGLQQGTVIFTSWCEFSHLSYVHIIHIWSHLPSRSNAISSLTSWNVMSHWTKFCSSVNYGPVSAALSMAT